MADIDLKPTEAMASNAERGLALREEHGRGGTEVGVARARDIKNRKTLSPETVKRMHSFFSRHEVDKKGKGWKSGSEGYPSAGLIAWLLWGGDSGKSWAERKVNQINGKSENSMSNNNNRTPLFRTGAKSINAARLVETVKKENVVAKIYKDTEWEEFVVKFFVDGVHHKNADSHHDDLEDAKGTARFAVDHYLKNQGKDKNSLEDSCWDGYEAVGTKKKDGKTVPNCVPMSRAGAKAAMGRTEEEFAEDVQNAAGLIVTWAKSLQTALGLRDYPRAKFVVTQIANTATALSAELKNPVTRMSRTGAKANGLTLAQRIAVEHDAKRMAKR